jgi:predicted O-methyltransferase YrrM
MAARAKSSLLNRLIWCSRAARLALEDPVEGLDRALLRVVRSRRTTVAGDEPERAWQAHLHALLAAPWPCGDCAGFDALYSETLAQLKAQGLDVGRAAFGGWDDANPAFARAVWSLAVHLRPKHAVETGVARGVTTRIILEALHRADSGHLWSIDRPPLDRDLHDQIGVAVPSGLRKRWTLLRGTSRRVLPGLLARVGPIDLFVHDSLHTERNLRFELAQAWPAMATNGALIADDIEQNTAFRHFLGSVPAVEAIVAQADDEKSLFGVAVRGSDRVVAATAGG